MKYYDANAHYSNMTSTQYHRYAEKNRSASGPISLWDLDLLPITLYFGIVLVVCIAIVLIGY